MAQWSTLMPCNREAAGSNLWGFGFFLKCAHYEVDYSGKKTYLAGLQCTLTSSCAIIQIIHYYHATRDEERMKMLFRIAPQAFNLNYQRHASSGQLRDY